MRAVDEHHVETRVTQTHGRLAEEIDDLVHLLLGNLLEQLGVHIGRKPRHPGLAAGKRIGLRDTPRMQDLARNRRAIAMHLLDKAMQAGNVLILADGEASEEVACAALVNRRCADRDHANATASLRSQELHERLGNLTIDNTCMTRDDRRKNQTILQLEIENLNRREDVREIIETRHICTPQFYDDGARGTDPCNSHALGR